MIAAISQRLAERAGFELPAWIVEARAASRIATLEVTADDYLALLASPRGTVELDALIEAVRVGESRLFRHRSQIAALIDHVVPKLRGKREIKVWSAGCSTGEEPYTLAAVLKRSLPGTTISVIATDVSATALATAEAARYPAAALADVPEGWRDAFVVDDDSLRVRPDVAALVRFERANLVDSSNIRGCDVVWCRNVLIYFTEAARRRVIDRIVAATALGGFVFVGYSETLRDVRDLQAVRAGEAVYYVRADRPPVAMPVPELAKASFDRLEPTPPPMRIPLVPPREDVYALHGHPSAREVTAELTARLAIAGLRRLVIDLDAADLLDDELAPVLRRARAAARAAHVELALRATRAGTRRWIARHALDEEDR
ncbi:MAG TPA: CheR family methyltransferase [Kofleriaceae bacterium]